MDRQPLLVALLGLCTVPLATGQLPPLNASERTQCKFQNHTDVTVEYTSIRRNGRTIFGGLVPYGKVWETGAKLPPTFVTSANLVVGGKELEAGHYTLSTIPTPGKWTMVVSKMPGKDGLKPIEEVARIDLLVRRLPSPLESFTIALDQVPGGCVLNLRWEQTEASVLLAEKK